MKNVQTAIDIDNNIIDELIFPINNDFYMNLCFFFIRYFLRVSAVRSSKHDLRKRDVYNFLTIIQLKLTIEIYLQKKKQINKYIQYSK